MTRERIAEGFAVLVLQLANDVHVPNGWEPHEWAWVKGLASGQILQLVREPQGSTGNTSQTSERSQT